MLPTDRRMRRSEEFVRTVRSGRRAGSRTLVVHLYDPYRTSVTPDRSLPRPSSRVGFVVGRGVGGSVVRSQVTRRLRHVMRSRLDLIPDGALVVVRALGPAAAATSAVLAAEVDHALDRLLPDARPTSASLTRAVAGAR